jgi:hypothetical protein
MFLKMTQKAVGGQLEDSWRTVGGQLRITSVQVHNMDFASFKARLIDREFQTLVTYRTFIHQSVEDNSMQLQFIDHNTRFKITEDICALQNPPSVSVVLYNRTEQKFVAVLLLSKTVRLVGGYLINIIVQKLCSYDPAWWNDKSNEHYVEFCLAINHKLTSFYAANEEDGGKESHQELEDKYTLKTNVKLEEITKKVESINTQLSTEILQLKERMAVMETKHAALMQEVTPTVSNHEPIQNWTKRCMWENEVGDKATHGWVPPCSKHGEDVIKKYCAYHQKLAKTRSHRISKQKHRKQTDN